MKSQKIMKYKLENLIGLMQGANDWRNQKFCKGINILPKDDENIWFANNLVTISVDNEFIRSRIKRAKLLYPYVSSIIAHGKYMYSYNFVEGRGIF